jgi:transposase
MKARQEKGLPEETQRVATAAFPKGNIYMKMRDELGDIYEDEIYADLYSKEGQRGVAPGKLAWVTIMQFSEGLSDRQAAEAVRARIDWKYVLGLELTDAGFDFSVLSEYRGRLVKGGKEQTLLDLFLKKLQEKELLKGRGQQRTDSTHVLCSVRQLNRVEDLGEAMRKALNELSTIEPEWVKSIAPLEWFYLYGLQFQQMRLPKEAAKRIALMEKIGEDGKRLLELLQNAPNSEILCQLGSVEYLRRLWIQQYWTEVKADGTSQLRLRSEENQPPTAKRLHTPHDEEARFSAKNDTEWVGYKAHLTETCDPEEPHIITQVTTTAATESDMQVLKTVYDQLEKKDLLPDEHLLDSGYVNAETLATTQQKYGVQIISPLRQSVSWQAKVNQGYDLSQFQIDWDHQTVTCPQGQTTTRWKQKLQKRRKRPAIYVRFSSKICRKCSAQKQCTRDKSGSRSITFLSQEQHHALQQNREAQKTGDFWKRYAPRAGIEGTISQGVRGFDLRCSRYVGHRKTHLQMIAVATTINLHRLFDRWEQIPVAATRLSRFARLAPSPDLLASSWGKL